MQPRYRVHLLFFAFLISACSGDGCGGCAGSAIPGGFPAESRVASAIQIRVSDSALAAIEADPAALVSTLLGQEQLSFPIPASCDGNPEVCCDNGVPSLTCGPLNIDLDLQAGDLPRLELVPVQGAKRVDVTVRARLRSAASIPVRYSGVSCTIDVDTSAGNRDDMALTLAVHLPQDPDEQTTRLDARNSAVDLENADVTISGGFVCSGANAFLKGFVIGLITDQITALLEETVSQQGCVACLSGTTDECGSFATSCQNDTCMIGDRCEQRIGLAQRMTVASIFGGLSGGQLGSLDLYDVAGGYAETNAQGISLGMYSGALPFAETRDRCGPPATAPQPMTVAQSSFFQGNTRPDTGASFGLGIGIHQEVLNHLAYALYESGALCLNIGASSVSLLTTDGLAPLLMPSVTDLLHGTNSSIVIGLRPQAPPTIAIGAGTTMAGNNGETVIVEPLLDIRLDGAEIDFFVTVDDQVIRAMTLRANIHLPMNLEVNGAGEIEPVFGDIDNAFSEVTVFNSEALRESNEDLEDRIPVLLNLALGPLAGSLGGFALPEIGGLRLAIADEGIVSLENNSFVAIFADLDMSVPATRVETRASIEPLVVDNTPVAKLLFSGGPSDLEHSYRVDSGPWSLYTSASEVLLSRSNFLLPGQHNVEVRSRKIRSVRSLDATPLKLTLRFEKPGSLAFHGTPKEHGCSCNTGGGGGWSALLIALVTLLALRFRRSRGTAGLAQIVFVATLSIGAQACTCSSSAPACPDGCLEGEVERGPTGRYSSLASDGERVVVSAYDEKLGDLVLIERMAEGELHYRAIAGLPDVEPTYEPDGYRGGIAGPGPNQGLWTSIALHQGLVRIAFVDADTGSLYFATEQDDGSFVIEPIDEATGIDGASYVSLSIDASGDASVAYLAQGLPSPDTSGFIAELRVASQSASWQPQVVDLGPVSCGGYCESTQVCVAGEIISECIAPSGDCANACTENEACIAGTCSATVEAPTIHDLAGGVGLFAKLAHRSDDSMILVYYDRILGNLKIATSTGTGFAPAATIDDPRLDLGMWLTMAIDAGDAAHLAFQDATGDRLMYARFAGGAIEATEVVDDGLREGEERPHSVGASASIAVDGDRIPTIVYQDALTSDVDLARREQDSWTRSALKSGDRLDGFFLQSTASGTQHWVSHYFYDRAQIPMGELEIVTLP